MKKVIFATVFAAIMGLHALPATAATRAEIAADLVAACSGGGDCAVAVNAAIALATTPDLSVVIGQGLADAVAMVGDIDPELATPMLTLIAAAPADVQTAYQIAVDVSTAAIGSTPVPPAPATPDLPANTDAGSPG